MLLVDDDGVFSNDAGRILSIPDSTESTTPLTAFFPALPASAALASPSSLMRSYVFSESLKAFFRAFGVGALSDMPTVEAGWRRR